MVAGTSLLLRLTTTVIGYGLSKPAELIMMVALALLLMTMETAMLQVVFMVVVVPLAL